MLRGSSKPNRRPPRGDTVPSGSGRLPSDRDARSGTYPDRGGMMMGYPTAAGPIDRDARYVARLSDDVRSGTYPAQGGVMTGYPTAAGPTDRALFESAGSGYSKESISTRSHYASEDDMRSSIRSGLMMNCLGYPVLSSSSASQSSVSVGSMKSYDADNIRLPAAGMRAGPPAVLRPEYQAGSLPVGRADRADGPPTPVAMGASHGVPAPLPGWGELSGQELRALAQYVANSGIRVEGARSVESAPAPEPRAAAGPSDPAVHRRPAVRRSEPVSPDSPAPVLDRRPAAMYSAAAPLDGRAVVPDPPFDDRAEVPEPRLAARISPAAALDVRAAVSDLRPAAKISPAASESRPAAETGEKVEIEFLAPGTWEVEARSGHCAAFQTRTGGHMTAAGNVHAPADMLMNMLESKDEEMRIITGRLAASFEENKAEKEKLLETLASFKRANEELKAQNTELWAIHDQHVKTIKDHEMQIDLFANSFTCIMKFADTMGSTLDSLATGVNGLKTLASERPVPGGYFQIRTRGNIHHIMDNGLDEYHYNHDEVCRKLRAEIDKREEQPEELEEGERGGDAGSFGPRAPIPAGSVGTPMYSSASSTSSSKAGSKDEDSLLAIPVTDLALLVPVKREVDLEALKTARYSPQALNMFLDSMGKAQGMPEFIRIVCNFPLVRDLVPDIADDLTREYVKLFGSEVDFTVEWVFEKLCFINTKPSKFDGEAIKLYRGCYPTAIPESAAIPSGVPSEYKPFFKGTAVDFASYPEKFFKVFVTNYLFWRTQTSDTVCRCISGV